MNEEFDRLFNNQDLYDVIGRYRDMMEGNKSCFFDLFEFEEIVDYFIDHQEYSLALDAVKLGLKHYPYSISLKLKKARSLCEKGSSDLSLKVLNEVESVEYYNFEVHLQKGISHVKLGNQYEAVAEFDTAIRLCRENRDDLVYEIAMSFLKSDQPGMALKYLQLAHQINEVNLLVIYELAACYDQLDNLEKSIKFYNCFLDIDPFAENVWLNLGSVYMRLDSFAEALHAFEYALAINPKFISALLCKAEALVNLGEYAQALNTYNDLIANDAENVQAFCGVGHCRLKLDQADEALVAFEQARFYDNTFPESWYGIALVFYLQDKFTHSLSNLNRAIRHDPDNYDFLLLKGDVLFELNKPEEAFEALQRATTINPDEFDAWYSLSQKYIETGRVEEAMSVIINAYQHTYDVSTINFQYAVCCSLNGEHDKSIDYFRRGISLNFDEHTMFIDCFHAETDMDSLQQIIDHYRP